MRQGLARNKRISRMTRADWQQIAEERLLATQALLAAHNWPSAYYLAGYAVECGLKWSEKSRYQMKTQTEAEELYNAIADTANGVMQWIRARW
jgi:hypothetical protein